MAETVRYAGFWRRLAASLIDTLILFIVLSPLLFFFSRGAYFPDLNPNGDILAQLAVIEFDWSYLLINDLLPMVLVIFFWVRFRATPGKRLMECEVVDASTHANLRTGQSVLRYIGYFLSLLPLGLGFLWIIWDRKKRGFHDLLAHTVVLQVDPARDSLAEQPLEKLMKEAE
ncbi:MAG TPA: RDD family protein [Gammaproteobacteria bacterium]